MIRMLHCSFVVNIILVTGYCVLHMEIITRVKIIRLLRGDRIVEKTNVHTDIQESNYENHV